MRSISLLRRCGREQVGQVLVLTAVVAVVLLGFAALVVDVGYAYYTKRALQASADAAALAGAQDLPDGDVAVGRAREYSASVGGKNARRDVPGVATLASATCRAGAPCRPVNAVEVTETAAVKTTFARVLGFETFTVRARAVAMLRAGRVPWAIFVHDPDCGEFEHEGDELRVDGGIRSNGEFEMEGDNITVSYASAGGPNDCEIEVEGRNIDIGGDDRPIRDSDLIPWPVSFTPSQFQCTFRAKKFEFRRSNFEIPPGVYCAEDRFRVRGDGVRGNITVIAEEIEVEGDDLLFTPYQDNVLFFATDVDDDDPAEVEAVVDLNDDDGGEIEVEGDRFDLTGILYAPGGEIEMEGDFGRMRGLVAAQEEVEIEGDGLNFIGTGPGLSPPVIALVE